MAQGGVQYDGPIVSRPNEKSARDKMDPSNLPYLHKNPAVWENKI